MNWMKKTLYVVIAALIALGMFSGCGKKTAGDTSWEDIKSKGFFIVGLDDSFPPMGFRDEKNEIVGFDIDFAKEAAKRMGVEVRFQPVVWDFIGQELNGKKVDVIWNGCTITDARRKVFDFTEPYMENKQVVVTKTESDIQTLEDLAGKKVGIQGGSSANIALDNHPEVKKTLAKLSEYSDNAKALTDLEIGRLDAVIVDVCVFGHYRRLKPGVFRMLEQDLGAEEFGVGVRKSDKAFRAELQKAMDSMVEDGAAQKIADKWFGKGAQVLSK
jgi:polar amino acid transport system substrate-binding protein